MRQIERAAIDFVLRWEGGWSDNPADPGGPTNMGITLATFSDWIGRKATVEELKNISRSIVDSIYRTEYILAPGFGSMRDATMFALTDCGVPHGTTQAVRFLQRALNVSDDGVLGPKTMTAAGGVSDRVLARRVIAERIRFFGRIISNNLTDRDRDGIPDNTEFAHGWLNRCAELIEALESVGGPERA